MAEDIRITLRIPPDVHRALTEQARQEQRSLNGQIVYLLRLASEGSGDDQKKEAA